MNIDLRKANREFHDFESSQYDRKWGIIFDEDSSKRVKSKFEKALGFPFPPVRKLLDVGCGTGYASLNICMTPGLVEEVHACDISSGMVEVYFKNASDLGIDVNAKRSELESLDYEDCTFDMVVGHAILHHIPDLEKALSEICRVLVPGGVCVLVGEPTRTGDMLGRLARRFANSAVNIGCYLGFKMNGRRMRKRSCGTVDESDLAGSEFEDVVDVHTFDPAEICGLAKSAGFCEVRYESEELLSSFVGWITRTAESILPDENVSYEFRLWSYNTFLKLSDLDERLYPFLPSSWFYNMLLYARKPK